MPSALLETHMVIILGTRVIVFPPSRFKPRPANVLDLFVITKHGVDWKNQWMSNHLHGRHLLSDEEMRSLDTLNIEGREAHLCLSSHSLSPWRSLINTPLLVIIAARTLLKIVGLMPSLVQLSGRNTRGKVIKRRYSFCV